MWAHAARGIALSMRGLKARGCSDAMVLAGTIASTHACVPEQCSRADPCAKPLRARHIDRTVIFGGRSVQPTAISARLRAAMSDGAKRTCDHTVCGLTLTRTCARVRVRVRARLHVRVRACVYSCRHLRAVSLSLSEGCAEGRDGGDCTRGLVGQARAQCRRWGAGCRCSAPRCPNRQRSAELPIISDSILDSMR